MIAKPVVLITGVSSGIGLATAQRFHSEGWVVVGTIRERTDLPLELTSLGLDLKLAEMTKPTDLARVLKATYTTYGRIDALVANAGYALAGQVEELEFEDFQNQLAVNVVAVAELAKLVLPIMREAGKGRIVALSSIAGRMGLPSYGAYVASKYALEGLFESLWLEISDTGIKLRLIEPSSVRTAFWTKGLVKASGKRTSRYSNAFLNRSIRQGSVSSLTPEDIASRIYKATISDAERLHYGVGSTWLVTLGRHLLPDRLFRTVARRVTK